MKLRQFKMGPDNILLAKLIVYAYWGICAALAAVVIYFGVKAGHSIPLMILVVSMLFMFIIGTISYYCRSYLLRQQGKQPPQYLKYLFQTEQLNQPAPFPVVIQYALFLIMVFGGMVLVLIGGLILLFPGDVEHSGVAYIAIVSGAPIIYFGYRLVRKYRGQIASQQSD